MYRTSQPCHNRANTRTIVAYKMRPEYPFLTQTVKFTLSLLRIFIECVKTAKTILSLWFQKFHIKTAIHITLPSFSQNRCRFNFYSLQSILKLINLIFLAVSMEKHQGISLHVPLCGCFCCCPVLLIPAKADSWFGCG